MTLRAQAVPEEHSLPNERCSGQKGLFRQNWTSLKENVFFSVLFQEEVSVGLWWPRTNSYLRRAGLPQPQVNEACGGSKKTRVTTQLFLN